MSLHIVILAAGIGKRMFSSKPKVLHPIGGKPMLQRVVELAQALKPQGLHLIYGHGGELIRAALPELEVNWVKQEKQLGTGHAVLQALSHIPSKAEVLVLSGDVPLLELASLKALIAMHHSAPDESLPLSLIVAELANPTGLGRILRDSEAKIKAIVEEKDATPEQRELKEIYSGICITSAENFKSWLPKLACNNAQGEYYLTDIIALAVRENKPIFSYSIPNPIEIQGVNTVLQLQELERYWQKSYAEKLLLQGVSIADANRIDVRGELICGKDVFIDVNCVFNGSVKVGDNCFIGPNCVLTNTMLESGCRIEANSILDGCNLGKYSQVGPFARLRPGTVLGAKTKIGNFVETKNIKMGENSKASHLSYLGDASIGRDVNIGAGTITCNYDGVNKHRTTIEDGVFVGSDTQFIAPVTIGAYATIGAGSTIYRNAPAGQLTLTRTEQKNVPHWKRPEKKEKV